MIIPDNVLNIHALEDANDVASVTGIDVVFLLCNFYEILHRSSLNVSKEFYNR